MASMKRPRVQVSLDHDVYEILKKLSAEQHKSLSYLIASIVKKYADSVVKK